LQHGAKVEANNSVPYHLFAAQPEYTHPLLARVTTVLHIIYALALKSIELISLSSKTDKRAPFMVVNTAHSFPPKCMCVCGTLRLV
jgi:hypothetical protein